MEAFLQVRYADGRTEAHPVPQGQTTVGRSPVAGIPLVNAEELAPEHLMLSPRAEGCWVAVAKGVPTGAVVLGQPFSAGIVPWGTDIAIAGLVLTVLDRPPAAPKKARSAKGRPSPVVLAAALLGVPAALYLLLAEPGGDLGGAGPPSGGPPELFPEDRAGACPAAGESALFAAVEAAEEASHRRERYPFDPLEGVKAVDLYDTSAACYAAAGRADDTSRIQGERDGLVRRIREDYKARRLRLERALEAQRADDATREARGLVALLRHPATKAHPYTRYLVDLERRLALKVKP